MDDEDTAMDFLSGYGFFTLGTLLGLLGQREKRRAVSPPSQSPLGNLWSPGVNK
jgi:hypothetical protein